jgi:PIN like domain
VKFLFDNNLPPAWPKAFKELSIGRLREVEDVISLRDKFTPNAPDAVWLNTLSEERNWGVISADFFRKRTGEREIIRQRGINVFVLGKTWTSHEHFAKTAQLVLWWPRIVEQASKVQNIAVEIPWRSSGRFIQIRL